jgi:cyclophilin family peptidyl-prolyl cis-trans isomerase
VVPPPAPKSERRLAVEKIWLGPEAEGRGPALVALLPGATSDERRLIVRALGQLGGQTEVAAVAELLASEDPADVGAAARALGVMARRKLVLDEVTPASLRLAAAVDPWGAAYVLANLPTPRDADTALVRELADKAQTRCMALRALAVTEPDVARRLDNPDPAVELEAVRALAGKRGTTASRRAVIAWVRQTWAEGAARQPPRAIALLEAMRLLEPLVSEEPQVAELFAELQFPPSQDARDLRVLDEAECLKASAAVRAGASYGVLLRCGDASGKGWPIFKRRELVMAHLADGRGPEAERLSAMEAMWRDPDPRVRGLGAAAAVKLERLDIALLALKEGIVIAGPAVDELVGRKKDKPTPPAIEELVLARAEAELKSGEPELLQGLLELLEGSTNPRAEAIRREAQKSRVEALRKAAGGKTDVVPVESPDPFRPPVPRSKVGPGWRLRVVTPRGSFHIEVDPVAAPRAVGALVALAEKRFYDGLIFHRVAPNFVVQGGDPTGSGWGGPGFLLPAEPSTRRYLRGTVGLADSGRDTAGSQWFVTLQESPHLEGRYTIVGQVPDAEMAIVDKLLIGDTMTRVEVVAP